MEPERPSWAGHPLWLVGFRPFFPLACVAAVLSPVAWVGVRAGLWRGPVGLDALQWHAHEMFYGFGFAVVAGFLLTATKNWVKTRGHYGLTLQLLVAAWLLERVSLWFGGAWPPAVRELTRFAFGVGLLLAIGWTLLRAKVTGPYRGNAVFLVALGAALAARALLLSPAHFAEGRELSLAFFRVLFVVMLERTLVQFMKATFNVEVWRVPVVDVGVKALAVALLAAPWLPPVVADALRVTLALLFGLRLVAWRADLALRRVDLAVMYLGGWALCAELLLTTAGGAWVGALPLHVFTFGTMGLIIPAMLLRIARGHTGRPVRFDALDRAVLWVMLAAFVARLVAPQLAPAQYGAWLWVAAGLWALGFTVTGARITPLLLAPRVDGKEH